MILRATFCIRLHQAPAYIVGHSHQARQSQHLRKFSPDDGSRLFPVRQLHSCLGALLFTGPALSVDVVGDLVWPFIFHRSAWRRMEPDPSPHLRTPMTPGAVRLSWKSRGHSRPSAFSRSLFGSTLEGQRVCSGGMIGSCLQLS